MLIKVRNYRGVQRADIELNHITLVAGRNEQGKSSLAEAVQAVLTGTPIIPNVNKKDAKVLVHDGAEGGQVGLWTGDAADRMIEWPKCTVVAEDGAPYSSRIAVGLSHPFDMEPDMRARWLGGYIKAVPTLASLTAEMADAGYSAKATEQVWNAVNAKNGWDETYQRARQFSTKTKGQWEEVTGEAYGSKKAVSWMPEHYPEGFDHETLKSHVTSTAETTINLMGHAAVAADRIHRLEISVAAGKEAENPEELAAALSALKASAKTKAAQRDAIPTDHELAETLDCPLCDGKLLVSSIKPLVLLPFDAKKAEARRAQHAEQLLKRAEHDADCKRIAGQVDSLERQLQRARSVRDEAAQAAAELEKIGANTGASETDIASAKVLESAAKVALLAFERKQRADELHKLIEQNEKLVALLAPEGLRQRALAAGLNLFNQWLSDQALIAGWPPVRFDESLRPHYGTRPLWAASESGKWRARAMVQMVLAKMDESPVIVLDGADVLDGPARNQLFTALNAAEFKSLVCMTIANRAKVPNLREAALGESYWIEGGVAEAL